MRNGKRKLPMGIGRPFMWFSVCLLGFICAGMLQSSSKGKEVVSLAEKPAATKDFTLQANRFDQLSSGMTIEDVRDIVGQPDFIRNSEQGIEHIYLFGGRIYNTYKFVTLTFDSKSERLVRGVYEKPESADDLSAERLEHLLALPYIG